jgi:predicted RND superfamily exporter protein
MWTVFARIILRNRLAILIVTGIITLFMAYLALKVELTYNGTRILPEDDSTNIEYEAFRNQFGEDGSVMAIGIQSDKLFQKDVFNAWYDLGEDVRKIEGVQSMLSITQLKDLVKDTTEGIFKFKPIMSSRPVSQAQIDSIRDKIFSLPFYDGLLLNRKSNVTVMLLTLDKKIVDSKNRIHLVTKITDLGDKFSEATNIEAHYSGLPYVL